MTDGPSNITIAQASQDKFEQYAIALTFTILGLSIQTAHFGVSMIAGSLEVAAWLSLLGSGLTGLWRWERAPGIYLKFHQHDQMKQRAMTTGAAIMQGTELVVGLLDDSRVPAKESFANEKRLTKLLNEVIEKANVSQGKRYRWQKWLFISGVVELVAARAYMPVVDILTALLHHLGH